MKLAVSKAMQVLRALIGVCLITSFALAQQKPVATGRVEGTVYVVDSEGRSYVPGAKVVLSGPTELQRETDAEGKFVLADVPAGTYTLNAQFGSLEGTQTVAVKAGGITQIAQEVKPVTVKSEVTVSATEEQVQGVVTQQTMQTISEKIAKEAPNATDSAQSLLPMIPGVVRGPDGRVNLKGARNTQSGALVNSANVTDPATGAPGLDLPIDVVESVRVISNPYDPQYGKLTGAVSTVDTKTSDYEGHHFSVQNIMPRLRVRDGSILGVGGATPRMTYTGPIIKDRAALTQSIEYRFLRTPSNSLPPTQRDTTNESVNSYTQLDLSLSAKQTATISFSLYPQKLKYAGLNTFTPQEATSDYHQRGYQIYAQHRYVTANNGLLTSQFTYKTFDADVTAHGSGSYRMFIDTTEGSFFNLQSRRSSRVDWQELYQFAPQQWLGTHQLKIGMSYAHSSYDSRQTFLPVEIEGVSGMPVERISFTAPGASGIGQNETTWFVSDAWAPLSRLSFDLGLRFDRDSVTGGNHLAPRGGFQLMLTRDGKTVLKGGAGVFYDRVPLMVASFPYMPSRTVSMLDSTGDVTSSTFYLNQITGKLHNPRSTAWNLALSRQVLQGLTLQVGYEWRKTTDDFVLSPACAQTCILSLANRGQQSYREFQVQGRYQFRGQTVNASYVHSRAYGDLNDFPQFYGNLPKAVIQADGQGRLSYDAPNRILAWGEFKAPWKLTVLPVWDLHTGFPYSVQNAYRDYIGPRNTKRFPRFSSVDMQVLRPVAFHVGGKRLHARIGFTVFNLFNHNNPRDVQTIAQSPRYGQFFNDTWREYRGKFVIDFGR